MSRSAERIAKLREKLAKLEGDVLVVKILGRPEIYIGSDEAVRKERLRREKASGSTIERVAGTSKGRRKTSRPGRSTGAAPPGPTRKARSRS
jgi:hypothetical protein